jgi:hypothetical protein
MPVNPRLLSALTSDPLADIAKMAKRKPADVPGVELPKSYGMGGTPDEVTVWNETPRSFLNSLTDDPAQSRRVIDRIVERNQGTARAVEEPELFQQGLDAPYTVVRGDFDQDGAAGIWDADRRVVALTDSGDPSLDAGYNPGDIDVLKHERTHALLQPEPGTEMAFVDSLDARNTTLSGRDDEPWMDSIPDSLRGDFNEGIPAAQNFNEFAQNKRELVNLLFNVKRMSEVIDGVDYGESLQSSNKLGKKLMRGEVDFDILSDTYNDPDMMDGYTRQVDYLRELYRASNEYGRAYIRDLMHKLGMVGAVSAAVTAGSENPLGGLTDE